MSTATAASAEGTPVTPRPWWAAAIVAVAVVAVAIAAVIGIRGLLADPVKGTDASGITTIEGSFEPYDCGTPCIGYVQAGGRSVTVILPRGCPAPQREQQVQVVGRLDPAQGKATYTAVRCATLR